MDARKIDRAVVSSAAPSPTATPQSGNEELDAEVKAHRDRLIPFAVINPTYAGWEDDLKTCRRRLRHARASPLPEVAQLQRCPTRAASTWSHAATERELVVSIPIRVEDPRQRSWLVDVPDVPLDGRWRRS